MKCWSSRIGIEKWIEAQAKGADSLLSKQNPTTNFLPHDELRADLIWANGIYI